MIDSGEVEKGRKELVDIVGMRDYNGNMRGGDVSMYIRCKLYSDESGKMIVESVRKVID